MFRINQPYNVFISHSWDYAEQYQRVKEWLNESNISVKDYSIPVEKRIDVSSKLELKARISARIQAASLVIVFAGMYVNYSEWIDYEISEAATHNKKILAVIPWGHERIPAMVQLYATTTVHWQKGSVIQGVKALL